MYATRERIGINYYTDQQKLCVGTDIVIGTTPLNTHQTVLTTIASFPVLTVGVQDEVGQNSIYVTK